jgi:two-component system sensor histidine kinase RegB
MVAANPAQPSADPPRAVEMTSPNDPDAEKDASRILLRWLLGLRFAVFGLLALTLPIGERYFGFHVDYRLAVPALVAVAIASAAVLRRRAADPVPSRVIAFGVALDLIAIGTLLAASGGAANPFSAVFFVHVALAASLLPARTTFALAALAAGVFAALFALPSGACCAHHAPDESFSAHLYGMWLAFVVAAALVAYFLTRVRRALEERGREIARLRRRAEEAERFTALGTLAGGTAHELATPLGTIAVLAAEIGEASGDEARDHAGAIAAQVARCRDILRKMQAGVAASPSAGAETAIGEAVRSAVQAWRKANPSATVTLREGAGAEAAVRLSADDFEAAVCALLDNALHASAAAGTSDPIEVAIERDGKGILVCVEDAGSGVAQHLRGRLGEPFLTTKQPGEGMGLGLYLVRTLLEQAGGRLEVSSREPRGTRVTLRLAEAGA